MSDIRPESQQSFATRVEQLLARTEYRRAVTTPQREAIFRMRYDCYLREEAIDANDSHRYSDRYDDLANAMLFGVFVDGILSSSLRIHLATDVDDTVPDKGAFPDIIGPMISARVRLVDVSRFVVSYEASRAHPGLAYLTVRVGWIAGEYFSVDRILTATRTEHNPFYRRVFGFKVETEARAYATLKKPVCLLSLDYRQERDRVQRRYPFFMSTEAERREVFGASVKRPMPSMQSC